MKKRLIRILALVLILSVVVFPNTVAAATGDTGESVLEPQASNYISTTYASTTNNGGSVTVRFNTVGTGKMSSIGAQRIVIKNSSGSTVQSFYYYTTAGMMSSNAYSHIGSVTWTGGSATAKYYAVVTFYAANSSGSDTATYVTAYS